MTNLLTRLEELVEVEAKTSRSSDFERLMNESYVALPKLLEVIEIQNDVLREIEAALDNPEEEGDLDEISSWIYHALKRVEELIGGEK